MNAYEQANKKLNELCGVKKTETRNTFKNITIMENLANSIPNLRVFKVKYIAPTNTRGSRVEIKETKRYSDQKDDKVTLPYDYQIGDILEQALQYLQSKGFEIVARGSEYDHYYVLVNSWGADYMDLKGNKNN